MRLAAFAFLLVLSSAGAGAAQTMSAAYKCVFVGNWGCGPLGKSGSICVDSPRSRNPSRYVLRFNFGAKPFPRIELNGLDGHLEPIGSSGDYLVYWRVGGMGHPKFSTSMRDGILVGHLVHSYPDGGSSSSEFKCARS